MAEIKGYPQSEEDVKKVFDKMVPPDAEIEFGELIIECPLDRFEELVSKAAMFDCLASAVKATGKVDDNVVKAITGTLSNQPMVPKEEADRYWDYYSREASKNQNLAEKVAELEHARNELIEILKQNNIGELTTKEANEHGEDGDHRESDA